jgi:subtilisin family serine protease
MTNFRYSTESVKVAILDTGVDIYHPDLQQASSEKRIVGCETLLNSRDPFRDPHGHGTHVARVVLKLAPPNVVLFIASVVDGEENLNHDEAHQTLERVLFENISIADY